MPIILEYPHSIKHYIKFFEDIDINYNCPRCDRCLWTHGSYTRMVHHRSKLYVIRVIRKRCPDCNKTYSFIPSFIKPWARFANHYREYVIRCILDGVPITLLSNRLVISLKTLYRWKSQIARVAWQWLISQRSFAIDKPEIGSRVLTLYREGATVTEEILFFLIHYFGGSLPRRGHVLSGINLSLPTKGWM